MPHHYAPCGPSRQVKSALETGPPQLAAVAHASIRSRLGGIRHSVGRIPGARRYRATGMASDGGSPRHGMRVSSTEPSKSKKWVNVLSMEKS